MPTAAERRAAIDEFDVAADTPDASARARALRRVSENPRLRGQEFNRAFVPMEYFGYLRRNPDDFPEAGRGFDGYDFWLGNRSCKRGLPPRLKFYGGTPHRHMTANLNLTLVLAGAGSLAASLLHLACIAGGPDWYRFFGAGERMARMAERGHWYPAVLTLGIAAILGLWALYAWSGAGLIPRLPFLRLSLCVITAVYLLRAVAFVPLKPFFPGNSAAFWYWSSGVCLVLGLLHVFGLRQVWSRV